MPPRRSGEKPTRQRNKLASESSPLQTISPRRTGNVKSPPKPCPFSGTLPREHTIHLEKVARHTGQNWALLGGSSLFTLNLYPSRVMAPHGVRILSLGGTGSYVITPSIAGNRIYRQYCACRGYAYFSSQCTYWIPL